jgi:hypothetical protein
MEGNGISPQLLRVCERLAPEGTRRSPRSVLAFRGDPSRRWNTSIALQRSDRLADIVKSVAWLRDRRGEGQRPGSAWAADTHACGDSAPNRRNSTVLRRRYPLSLSTPEPDVAFFGGTGQMIRNSRRSKHTISDDRLPEGAEHDFMRDGSENYRESAATGMDTHHAFLRNIYRRPDGTPHTQRPASGCRCSLAQ